LKTRANWKETTAVEVTVDTKEISEARSKLLGPKPIEGEYTDVTIQKSLEGPSAGTVQ